MIIGTEIWLATVPPTLVGTAVPTITVGTDVPTSTVGTHCSNKIGSCAKQDIT